MLQAFHIRFVFPYIPPVKFAADITVHAGLCIYCTSRKKLIQESKKPTADGTKEQNPASRLAFN